MSYGPPFDRLTKSGTSYHLFTALRRRGILAGVVNARPAWFDLVEKAGSAGPDMERWRQRYFSSTGLVSPAVREAMSRLGTARAARVDAAPDVLFQVSTWVDLGRGPRLRPGLRCCYLDGNVAAWMTRPDLALDPGSRAVRRTLAFERRVFDGMDLILTKSEWARRSFVEDYGQDPAKVVVVWTGANLPELPGPPPARDFGRPRLLFVGKNFSRKGGPHLLEAFARVRAERPDAELWIVGPSPRGPDADGVRWLGHVSRAQPGGDERVAELYTAATAFVMPTLYDGFGIPYVEAMAHGLPCIGTAVCAVPEIIANGRTGLLVPPADPARLADRILELLADPARARAMGAASHRRFLERFTWDRVAARIEQEILSRLDPPDPGADSGGRRRRWPRRRPAESRPTVGT